MATSKANPERLHVVVSEAEAPAQVFGEATSAYYGEAGTLAWNLAGRAWLHGYEQPEVRLYRGAERLECVRPTREACMRTFNRGAEFWRVAKFEEVNQ